MMQKRQFLAKTCLHCKSTYVPTGCCQKYCENCKNSLASQFGNMYKNNESAPATNKNTRDSARMRFLDK